MSSNLGEYETILAVNRYESELSENEQVLVRPFRPEGDDERQMGKLVFSNAFLGQPFDVICRCKQWFADAVLSPYIKYQPENIHVAVHVPTGRLIGYLTGSLGGGRFEEMQYKMVRAKIVSLAISLTMPWTIFDHSSRRFATHIIFRGEGERPNHPQSGVHWHFQVDKDFRAKGIGKKLFQRFVADALKANFKLIWAEVTSYRDKPMTYFKDRGWTIYDAKPTQVFGDHVDFPVQTLCITKLLSSFAAPRQGS